MAIRERDLRRVRLRLLDLCKSFFDREADAERLGRWRGIFGALAGAEVSPEFDREVSCLVRLLWQKGLGELQGEYRLMFGVYRVPEPRPTGSCFRNYPGPGEVAGGIREIMAAAGLEHDRAAKAPEGGLVVLLDILATLVEEEKGGDALRAREVQVDLLDACLVPLAEGFAEILRTHGADFFLHCGKLLCGYLALERELAGRYREGGAVTGQGIGLSESSVTLTGPSAGKGGAGSAFARLYSATAALTGAAMTEKTVSRAGANREPGRLPRSLAGLRVQTGSCACRTSQSLSRRQATIPHAPAEEDRLESPC